MSLYVAYVLVGLAIAMPVGAITVEMTKQGLKNGFMHGWAVGLGGMTIDIVLVFALYMGLASILAMPMVQLPMWIIGAGFLFLLGYDSIKNADHDITLAGEKVTKSFFASYFNGLLVAISPGNLVFWVNVFGVVLAKSYGQGQPTNFLIIAAGVLSGILLHDIGLLTIVSVTRKAMNRKMIKTFTIVAGFLLIGFAGYFIYEFIQAIKIYI
ncbi:MULTISPECIES: LysE family translocator [Lysinibacillus]|uniref:Lysine transporter LysE n=1 Tax=Lysinibacillus fusiformis TaxID=28031 RepID=A0A2I0V0S4_9BACI|nr:MULTISPECIES: LysE family transporter [Lysinibacillus]KUF31923.1 lysine transporter LysE [Lysinibacillus sp. F5]MEE3806121.1 LysE family transporter [Lysinibacillus fusiformis]PKU51849.1 lysine transporter LysE [Lysinibacillus fusiformis]WCH46131.1 LysE family translocator [Lysinibacillus sp. OF-1]